MNWKHTKHEKPQQHERVLCWSHWRQVSLATYRNNAFHVDGMVAVSPDYWASIDLPDIARQPVPRPGNKPPMLQRMMEVLDKETPESLARKLQSYGMKFRNPPPPLKEGETDD